MSETADPTRRPGGMTEAALTVCVRAAVADHNRRRRRVQRPAHDARHSRVPELHLFPDPAEPDLVARIAPGPVAAPDTSINTLARAVPHRHTNRRPFASVVIPARTLDQGRLGFDAT